MAFTEIDLLVSDTGDLEVSASGDLSLGTAAETLSQDVMFRLKTDHFDFGPAPFIGADLAATKGEPNNQRTADLLKEHIHISLTQDGRIPPGVLYVDVIPISIHKVQAFVIISDLITDLTTPLVVTKTVELIETTPDNESILNGSE